MELFPPLTTDEQENITEDKEVSESILTTINEEKDTALLHENERIPDVIVTKNTWIGNTGA